MGPLIVNSSSPAAACCVAKTNVCCRTGHYIWFTYGWLLRLLLASASLRVPSYSPLRQLLFVWKTQCSVVIPQYDFVHCKHTDRSITTCCLVGINLGKASCPAFWSLALAGPCIIAVYWFEICMVAAFWSFWSNSAKECHACRLLPPGRVKRAQRYHWRQLNEEFNKDAGIPSRNMTLMQRNTDWIAERKQDHHWDHWSSNHKQSWLLCTTLCSNVVVADMGQSGRRLTW